MLGSNTAVVLVAIEESGAPILKRRVVTTIKTTFDIPISAFPAGRVYGMENACEVASEVLSREAGIQYAARWEEVCSANRFHPRPHKVILLIAEFPAELLPTAQNPFVNECQRTVSQPIAELVRTGNLLWWHQKLLDLTAEERGGP